MRLLAMILIMASASALSISYDGTIIAPPGGMQHTKIYLMSNVTETLPVRCISNLQVICPPEVELPAGMERDITILFYPSRGREDIRVWIGESQAVISVIGSNQTGALLKSLEKLNRTFSNLKEKYGESEIILLASALIEEGVQSYREGDYAAVQGTLANLEVLLNDYYSRVKYEKQEEEPRQLGLGALPLAGVVIIAGVLLARRRGRQRPEFDGVAELVQSEMEGV